MSAKKPTRRKHVPQRTCVGCRQSLSKREMTRIVRQPDGVKIDPTGKLNGRGAYLHNQKTCWEQGLKGTLARALKTELTSSDYEQLRAYAAGLPDGPAGDETSSEKIARTKSSATGSSPM